MRSLLVPLASPPLLDFILQISYLEEKTQTVNLENPENALSGKGNDNGNLAGKVKSVLGKSFFYNFAGEVKSPGASTSSLAHSPSSLSHFSPGKVLNKKTRARVCRRMACQRLRTAGSFKEESQGRSIGHRCRGLLC